MRSRASSRGLTMRDNDTLRAALASAGVTDYREPVDLLETLAAHNVTVGPIGEYLLKGWGLTVFADRAPGFMGIAMPGVKIVAVRQRLEGMPGAYREALAHESAHAITRAGAFEVGAAGHTQIWSDTARTNGATYGCERIAPAWMTRAVRWYEAQTVTDAPAGTLPPILAPWPPVAPSADEAPGEEPGWGGCGDGEQPGEQPGQPGGEPNDDDEAQPDGAGGEQPGEQPQPNDDEAQPGDGGEQPGEQPGNGADTDGAEQPDTDADTDRGDDDGAEQPDPGQPRAPSSATRGNAKGGSTNGAGANRRASTDALAQSSIRSKYRR